MYRTLGQLRDSINQMIESQGEDAGCAAFVFTQHDVFEFNEETNQDDYFSTLFTQDVLCDVGGSSYIYEQVGEMIDDAIRLRKKLPLYANWIMTLTPEQISDLCQAHCYRVIENMDMDDLVSYAVQMMYQSFDKNPGQNDTDVDMLIEDIWVAEGEDDDATSEFIAGIVGSDLADEIMKTTQFWIMTLTSEQLNQLVELYAERCVDDMDTKCLIQFVYDTIVDNMANMSEHEVLDQISCVYDDETVQVMVESVVESVTDQ